MNWIKCSERMPQEGQRVLWFNGKIVWSGQIKKDEPRFDEFNWICCYGPDADDYQYWMPFPQLPKDKDEHELNV